MAIAGNFVEFSGVSSWSWFNSAPSPQCIFLKRSSSDSLASKCVWFCSGSGRMEIEADHIGLLLLGAAGYDPRIAPSVYEKLGKIAGDSALSNYLSTHPSSKKRAQLLTQAKDECNLPNLPMSKPD
ncbi:hypothetical protein GUJ93_ZPchr0002g24947 [Zizania palustris]|uniref:Peptidase M48 domain-containing protein n=1 Tax=Zizania palustris TaxID=103762 RepID=A0A8J5SQG7_ZIZPA|nr:hypothetical protein GUJ93_ZPchr0002g24947 [Zizania palustris]